jgi:hypothetical protein
VDVPFSKYMTAGELDVLQQARPARLAELDEDALAQLLQRVRRASSKYRTLHRRRASASVRRSGRGAEAYDERTAAKAEVFEAALARVSTALARAARASARELKEERLAAAATTRANAPSASRARGTGTGSRTGRPQRAAKAATTPASARRRASTRASGARTQVAKDRRGSG